MNDPKKVAAAVNGYVKALRSLGRKEICLYDIARALRIEEEEISAAFTTYRITGAKVIEPGRGRAHAKQVHQVCSHFSAIVELKS